MKNHICVLGMGRETVARVIVGTALVVAETGKWANTTLSMDGEDWEGVIVYGEIDDDPCCGSRPEKWMMEMNNVMVHQAVDAAAEAFGHTDDADFLVLRGDNDVQSAYFGAESNLMLHKEDQQELGDLGNELMDCLDAYLTARAQMLFQSRRRAVETLVTQLLAQGHINVGDLWEAMEEDVKAAKNSCDQEEAASAG